MNTTKSLCALVVFFLLACLTVTPVLNAQAVVPPASSTAVSTGIADVTYDLPVEVAVPNLQNVLQLAATQRGWATKVLEPGKVRCDIDVRGKHQLTVDVLLESKKITVRYVSSKNLKYDPAKGTIHRNYYNWLKKLADDTKKTLAAQAFSQQKQQQ